MSAAWQARWEIRELFFAKCDFSHTWTGSAGANFAMGKSTF
jgi:hypothetical protein